MQVREGLRLERTGVVSDGYWAAAASCWAHVCIVYLAPHGVDVVAATRDPAHVCSAGAGRAQCVHLPLTPHRHSPRSRRRRREVTQRRATLACWSARPSSDGCVMRGGLHLRSTFAMLVDPLQHLLHAPPVSVRPPVRIEARAAGEIYDGAARRKSKMHISMIRARAFKILIISVSRLSRSTASLLRLRPAWLRARWPRCVTSRSKTLVRPACASLPHSHPTSSDSQPQLSVAARLCVCLAP